MGGERGVMLKWRTAQRSMRCALPPSCTRDHHTVWVQNYLTVYDGKLYFAANDGNTGYELWQYDASSGAASFVADINTGSGGSHPVTMAHAHTLARGTQHS